MGTDMNDTSPSSEKPGMPWRRLLAWTALPLALVIWSGTMILKDRNAAPAAPTTLVSSGMLHGAEGMDFGPDGMLYAASLSAFSIVKIDPKTGAVTTVVGPPEMEAEADDVAVGPAGTPAAGIVAWTSPPRGHIGILRPGGKPEILLKDLPGINPIAFNKEGRLFAAQSGANENSLWEVDPTGAKPPRLVTKGETRLNGFDFGPDGKLYSPWQGSNPGKIVAIDVDTGDVKTIMATIDTPSAVSVAADGTVYSAGNDTLWATSPSGESKKVGELVGAFDNLEVGSDGLVYASVVPDSKFVVFDPATQKFRDLVPGTLLAPLGVAMSRKDGKDVLLVADPFGYRSVDTSTGVVTRGPWRRNRDSSISVGANDKIIAVLGGSGVAKKIDRATDEVVAELPAVKGARNMVLTAKEEIVLADTAAGRLVRVDADGEHVIAEGLKKPYGLAVDGDGLLVAEMDGGTIARIDSAGTRTEIAKGLQDPGAIARLADGSIAVIEGTSTVSVVDAKTGAKRARATGLKLDTEAIRVPANTYAGIAAGADGTLYVSAPRENKILKIAP